MEVFLGGALRIAWVNVLFWVVPKSAARALRGDQFNSGKRSWTRKLLTPAPSDLREAVKTF